MFPYDDSISIDERELYEMAQHLPRQRAYVRNGGMADTKNSIGTESSPHCPFIDCAEFERPQSNVRSEEANGIPPVSASSQASERDRVLYEKYLEYCERTPTGTLKTFCAENSINERTFRRLRKRMARGGNS